MPRRSLRVSDVATPRSSSKRPTPSEETVAIQGPRSKKVKQQSVSKKTKPVSPEDSDVISESDDATSDDNGSGYEDEEPNETSEDEPEDESSEEDEKPTVRRKSGVSVKKSTPTSAKGRPKTKDEIWQSGAAPGTQMIMKKPRARSPGDTPYTDETIHPNTMLFLKDLAANNDRQWLKSKSTRHRFFYF